MEEETIKFGSDNKSKIIIGFIHYGESDNLSKLFETLHEFRKKYGLKYTHQSKEKIIFFNISSEYLEEFGKVQPFTISRFQTKSEYLCDKEIAIKLQKQRDSFIRMMWDEESTILTFMSRTSSVIHNNLIKRIFNDSQIEFQKNNYKIIKYENKYKVNTNEDNTKIPEGFQRIESKKYIQVVRKFEKNYKKSIN